nr:immunoglobulin light chain junction region [Macaca mulatta]MOV68658.1 immunoglobulin light chain junction region [Macaca mulatta]MOV69144.1 immunoglobulin light chain junction region [Macaca mulatta]MOV69582.1 immunoglobulin light chain junction region [Macaca mulatta]MOV70811.1 immunoglobulin light chain junction region [Macaca mulatta]
DYYCQSFDSSTVLF